MCASVFDTYMRDVEFSPDGSNFVIGTTGAYSANTLCDTVSRWPSDGTGSNLQPTWVDYTGGDSIHTVAVTGTAIYAGGHNRWLNNPFAGDRVGPGAVPREGIAALDPTNGLPLSWNPGRDRGIGVFAMVSTAAGLWVGSDTDHIGGETHRKIAFFPVEGGTAIPSDAPYHLPSDLYNLTANRCIGVDESVLFRVNAGGPELPALDCGPNWMADNATGSPGSAFRNAGSNTSSWNQNFTVRYEPAGTVPTTTPRNVFATERWDPSASPELAWDFPVAAGAPLEVRLYFANQFDGTGPGGTPRVFDVTLDGNLLLDDYNIFADVGHRSGAMKAFTVTSDGNVDIDLLHVAENPLINGIEIVRTDVAPGPFPPCPGADPSVLYRVNGGGPEIPATDCGPNWLADTSTSAPGAVFHNTGNNAATWNQPFAVLYQPGGPVPTTTPSQLFLSERWDPSSGAEMAWDFIVPAGTPIQVRLFFINQCSCTGVGGTPRVFDVRVDGTLALDDYNILTDVGDRTGTVKAFDVTSDGNVDIDFGHASENPLINAIEIVRTDLAPVAPTPTDRIERRQFDGASFTAHESLPTLGIDWTNARGAFALGGVVYTGWNDGRFTARGFSGNLFGPELQVNLFGLTNFPVSSLTGMFYANHGIYYTVEGDARMYYRYFTPESRVVGAEVWIVSGAGDGLNWSSTRGLTLVDGSLYLARTNGDLSSMGFGANGSVMGGASPIPGTELLVSPASDGYNWASRGLFAFESVPLDTSPPTVPGTPTGVSSELGTISLSWPASSDDNPPIFYRIYRDGQPVPIAEVTGTFHLDEGLTPGNVHTYAVQALDGLGNASGVGPSSTPIVVDSAIFADDLSTGDFSLWTSTTRLSIDNAAGDPSAPSAFGSPAGQSAFATKDLGTGYDNVCASFRVSVGARTGSMVLMRLQGENGEPIARLLLNASGILQIRSDFAAATFSSGVALGTGWHQLELCGAIGTSGAWSLYRDGAQIVADWSADSGTAPIGRIEVGNPVAGTWSANFDDVRVDQAVGEHVTPDTTPPTVPGQPSGTSPALGTITIGWAASTDDSPPVTYRIYRDGGGTPIGQSTTPSYTDQGLTPGASHSYTVDAVDAADNVSAQSSPSSQITVETAVFIDDFSTSDLARWTTATRFSIDSGVGNPSPPSALGSAAGQTATLMKDLGASYGNLCVSFRVNVTARTGSMVLTRWRTSTSGPVARMLVNNAGILQVKSDVSGVTFTSGVALGSGWHKLELCGTVGASGAWNLYRDGAPVVTNWIANTNTTPIGRIEIGSPVSGTWTANFDDVRIDQAVGDNSGPDTSPPTVPGRPSGTSPSLGTVVIGWAESTDDSPPVIYRIYRDGGGSPIGQSTVPSFSDSGLVPGSSHTYTVDAVDAANNASAQSPASDPIVVQSAIFTDDFSSGGFAAWTSVTRLAIDSGTGDPAPPSALGNPTSQSAFAMRDLGSTYADLCVSFRVNVAARTGSMVLTRWRTAASGPIARLLVNASGILQLKSDVSGTTFGSGVALGPGWHELELCGTVGAAAPWDLYRDGAQILTGQVANTGTTPIGRVEIGSPVAGTWTAFFDDVQVDQAAG
jgi:chitodextrinase